MVDAHQCDPDLIHPIPNPPLTVIQVGAKGYILVPNEIPETEVKEHPILSAFSGEITSWDFIPGVIDDRTSIRMILSILRTKTDSAYMTVKELVHKRVIG